MPNMLAGTQAALGGISSDIWTQRYNQARLDEEHRQADETQQYRTDTLALSREQSAWQKAYQQGQLDIDKKAEARAQHAADLNEPLTLRRNRALDALNSLTPQRVAEMTDSDIDTYLRGQGFPGGFDDAIQAARGGVQNPVNWQTLDTSGGYMQVNPQTGRTRPVMSGERQVEPAPRLAGADEVTRRQVLQSALDEVDSAIADAREQANLPDNRSRRLDILRDANQRAEGIAVRRGFGSLQALRDAAGSLNREIGLLGSGGSTDRLAGPTGGASIEAGTRPSLAERVRELQRQGITKERAREMLKAEGYDVD